MLLNGCIISVFVLTFRDLLLCDAEETQEVSTVLSTTVDNIVTDTAITNMNTDNTVAKITADTTVLSITADTTVTSITSDTTVTSITADTDITSIPADTTITDTSVTTITPANSKKFALKLPLKDFRKERKNTVNKIKLKDGKPATEHIVPTMDGYMLTIIQLGSGIPTEKYPVLLVHGMFQSSDRFLDQEKSRSLAYALDNLGYDVWLFNARGNKHSPTHSDLAPHVDKAKYNDYTYEEIGSYDLAETVDYIIAKTKSKKIHYIGHSLGGTFFLILNSLKTEYNEKFDRAFLMAPLGYHTTFPNTNLQKMLHDPTSLHETLKKADTFEIFPYEAYGPQQDIVAENCLGSIKLESICKELHVQKIMGLKEKDNSIADSRGGSTKTLIHWAQNIKNKKFHRWDLGESENKEMYDTKDPPEYPLKAIKVRTKIIYSSDDDMVKDTDIRALAKQMKNATARKVKRAGFKHDDFIDGQFVMEDVYNGIIQDLEHPKPLVIRTKEKKSNSISFSDIPWTALLALAGIVLCIAISLINCCCKKKKKPCTSESQQPNPRVFVRPKRPRV